MTQVLDQVNALQGLVGQSLDFNVYLDGQAVVLSGQILEPRLYSRLAALDPNRLRFSKELSLDSPSSPARDTPITEVEGALRRDAVELLNAAGINEALSEEVRQVATKKVREVFESCRYLTKIDLGAAEQVVANLVRRTGSLSDSAFKLDELRNIDEYTFMHSVNVCTLGITVFKDLLTSEAQLTQVGLGLLLHDIGMSKVDIRILGKPNELTPDEEVMMRKHVTLGYNLVKGSKDLSEEAKNMILNHHERLNGSGYLRGLREHDLSTSDMLCTICDVFDAVTTNRSYRSATDVHRAVTILIQGSLTQFQPRLVNHFLTQIGRFPVGTFVALSNGEVGVVSQISRVSKTRPVIKVLFDEYGDRLKEPRTLNLYEEHGIYIVRPIDKNPGRPAHHSLQALGTAF